MRTWTRTSGWLEGIRGAGRVVVSAALLATATLLPDIAQPVPTYAEWVETSGEVFGADVEGTIWLNFDSSGGELTGRIEMTVRFDCRGKTRHEHHVLELTKGRVEGDRIIATAVYVERSGLPKDELSRCKSAYETYQTREDSRRLIGTLDAEGKRASGTLGEYRPTVSWSSDWQPSAAPVTPPAEDVQQPRDAAIE